MFTLISWTYVIGAVVILYVTFRVGYFFGKHRF